MKKLNTNKKKYIIAFILILIFAACFIPNPEVYNAKYPLQLVSSYGDNEAYHPKVLNFKEKWNGYKYWMAYTPYPQGDDAKENPHIVASNDLVNWEVPQGLKNPLDEPKETKASKKYNSDAHIVYNNDLNRMECYWRYVDDIEDKVYIYRRYSNDGINWSPRQTSIIGNPRSKKDYISPAILYDNGVYKMWYVDQGNILMYTTSSDGMNWQNDEKVDISYKEKVKTWHLDVIKTQKGYEMLVVAFENWEKRNDMNLFYTTSKDGIHWEKAKVILRPTTKTDNWDNKGIYRSSFIYENGKYYVYYSGTNIDMHHGIGLMYGKDIYNLKTNKTNYKITKENQDFVKELKEI